MRRSGKHGTGGRQTQPTAHSHPGIQPVYYSRNRRLKKPFAEVSNMKYYISNACVKCETMHQNMIDNYIKKGWL